MLLPAIMLGMSAWKAHTDAKRAQKQRIAESETTRYSPWTGMKGQTVTEPDTAGTLMQGAAGAASQFQAGQAANQASQLHDAQMKRYGAETDLLQGMSAQNQAPVLEGSTGWKPAKKPMYGGFGGGSFGAMA